MISDRFSPRGSSWWERGARCRSRRERSRSGSPPRRSASRSSGSPASRCSRPGTSSARRSRASSSRGSASIRLSGYFLFVLGLVGAPARRLRHALPRAGRDADAITAGAHRRLPARSRARALRTRPADVPRGLGADDARAGGDHPRGAARPGGPELGVRLHRAHAPDGRGHLDRGAAARRRRSVRRGRRDRGGLRARRSRSPSPRSSAWGRKPGSCRCTRGCPARTRSRPRTSRR